MTVIRQWTHGVDGYRNQGCRCDTCRSAWAGHRAQQRERARQQGLPDGDPRHGTRNGYQHHGCRCQPCRTTQSTATSADARRARARQATS